MELRDLKHPVVKFELEGINSVKFDTTELLNVFFSVNQNNVLYANNDEERSWYGKIFVLNGEFVKGQYQGYLEEEKYIIFLGEGQNVISYIAAEQGKTIQWKEFDIPEGTVAIATSYNSTKDVEFGLTLFEKPIDVTRWVYNWDEVEVSLKRDGLTSVLSEVMFPIQLIRQGMEYLRQAFERDGLRANVTFNIYHRDNWWRNKYELVSSMKLDFSTYREYPDMIEIEGTAAELIEYMNAGGSTKFDIPVSEIAEEKKWEYQRMYMINAGNFTLPVFELNTNNNYYQPLIQLNKAEMVPDSAENDIKTQKASTGRNNDYFFECSEESLLVNFNIDITVTAGATFGTPRFFLALLSGSEEIIIREWVITRGQPTQIKESFSFRFYHGEKAFAYFRSRADQLPSGGEYAQVIASNLFQLSYSSKGASLDGDRGIAVIKPEKLLQKYLDLISNRPGYFECEIHSAEEPYQTMLCAAESIRNFPEALIHGSLNDFTGWMHMLGFEYEIIYRKIIYRKREYFYQPSIKSLEFNPKEIGELIIQADNTFVYTNLQIGFKKQEYESVNGKLEANFPYDYITGHVARDEQKLNLTTQFRSDPIGVELLCWKRYEPTTDTKSDNDIFCIALSEENSRYIEYKAITIKDRNYPELEMFNAPFNPYFLIIANKSYLGISTELLRFAGTEGNSSAYIEGIDIYSNHQIQEKLFSPIKYSLEVGTRQLLPIKETRGLIHFKFNGTYYKGYINDIIKNYGKETMNTWILYGVKN